MVSEQFQLCDPELNIRVLFLLIVLLLICPIAKGQPLRETIWLGDVELGLGMPRDVVVAKLAESYQLNKTEADSFWVVSKDGPPHTVVGNVGFKNGKLSAVLKYWGPEDQQKGLEFANSLYAAIASLSKNAQESCSVNVGETNEPQVERKSAFITCGQRYIRMDIVHNKKGGDSAGITEVLEVSH
jgi:hypothetical protein